MNNSIESKRTVVEDFHNIEFDSDIHALIYQYWLDLKGNKPMPRKGDFNPANVVASLPFIVMTEVHNDPTRFKFRLAGTKIVSTLGINVSGHWLEEYQNMDGVQETYSWVTDHKRPCYFHDTIPWPVKDFTQYSAVTLPFSNSASNVDYLISTLHFF